MITIFSKNIQKVSYSTFFEIIFFSFKTDETQTLIFRMFCMLIENFMLVFMIPGW